MGRNLSPEQHEEYERLKRFYETAVTFLTEQGHLPAESLTLARNGLSAVEARGASAELRGLRMAVADLLEMTRYLPPEQAASADRWLGDAGAPSLDEMRRRFWSKIPKILARGRIRNEEEYYLLRERVIDTTDVDLTAADREKAARLIATYENQPHS